MIRTSGGTTDSFEYWYGTRPFEYEWLCGDAAFAVETPDGLLLGLIDGLGHGRKAAEVAAEMQQFFEKHGELPLDELLRQAHEAFRGSQGAAVLLVRLFRSGELEQIGVGNVSCRIVSEMGAPGTMLLSKDGALGLRMRSTEMFKSRLQPGEGLLLYSDGISEDLIRSNYRLPMRNSSGLIETLIERFGKRHDDASVLYCTYNHRT